MKSLELRKPLPAFFTRKMLAKRWSCSIRTIDRRRTLGEIPWVDLTAGKGRRPTVRFQKDDILKFEIENKLSVI